MTSLYSNLELESYDKTLHFALGCALLHLSLHPSPPAAMAMMAMKALMLSGAVFVRAVFAVTTPWLLGSAGGRAMMPLRIGWSTSDTSRSTIQGME